MSTAAEEPPPDSSGTSADTTATEPVEVITDVDGIVEVAEEVPPAEETSPSAEVVSGGDGIIEVIEEVPSPEQGQRSSDAGTATVDIADGATTASTELPVAQQHSVSTEWDNAQSAQPGNQRSSSPSIGVTWAPIPPSPALTGPLAAVNTVASAISSVLAGVGLSPVAASTPAMPVESPALWAVLAWARRPFGDAVSASAVPQAPTGVVAAQDISATMAATTTVSTDPIGGLIGGLLHLLFNNAPTASYDPAQNTQMAGGVIAGTLNATDPDGDSLSFTVTEAPAHGTVVVSGPDGTFTYTPEADFAHLGGTDSFTVVVEDNHPSLLSPAGVTTVSVSVTVDPVNQPPVVGDPAFTIDHIDPATGVVTGSVNVTDEDGDPLTYSAIGEPQGVTIDAATGDWTYAPRLQDRLKATDVNATADDQQVAFTINATDGAASTGVLVTAPVTPLAISTIDVGGAPLGVAFGPNGSHAFVTNGSDGTVLVIDTDTNQVIATITDVGEVPLGVVVRPDGAHAYVTNLLSQGTVTVIDVATNTVVGDPFPVGSFPAGIAVTPSGSHVYVVNVDDGTVSVIDTATNQVAGDPIPVGAAPADIVITLDGTRAYVVSTGSGTVSVIDTATNTVTATVAVGEFPSGVAVSPDGRYVYVSNNGPDTVSVIDTATNEVMGEPIPVGIDPFSVVVSPDGRYVYVMNAGSETMSVIDTATKTVIADIGMSPGRVALNPDGTLVYVTNTEDGTVSVISTLVQDTAPAVTASPMVGTPDPVTGTVSGTVSFTDSDGDILSYELSTPPDPATGIVTVDSVTGAWTYTPSLQARLKASDINATPDDQRVAFLITASDGQAATSVTVAAPITALAIATIDVGRLPQVLAVSPDGSRVYVANTIDDTVSVIDTATNSVTTLDVDSFRVPTGVAVSPDGTYVYVTNQGGIGTVSVIDTATNQVVGQPIPVGDHPVFVVVSPDGTRAYVANIGTPTEVGNVSVIDTTTNTVVTTVTVGDAPGAVAVSPDGARVYVTDLNDGTVSVIDTTTNTVVGDPIDVGNGPVGAVAVSPDGQYVYVGNVDDDTVSVIDTATNTVVADPIPVGHRPAMVALSPEGAHAYVANLNDGTLSVIDTATNTVIATLPIGSNAGGVAVSSDGNYVYVTNVDLTNLGEPGAVSVIALPPATSTLV